MTEIWKDIEGFEGLYQVSNLGNIKSLSRIYFSGNRHNTKKYVEEHILTPRKTKTGYCRVMFVKDGKKQDYYIHRIVALTFLQNPDNLPDVNHKDENKENNSVDNLEFCTRKYNCNYGDRNNKVSIANKEYRRRIAQA